MLEVVSGMPDTVVAVVAKGRVTRQDYQEVLVPRIDQALASNRKIRCYYELGTEFAGMDAGAMWEDFKVGFEHLASWERVAIVTDVEWIRHALNAFRFLVPGEIRVFAANFSSEARAWISGA